MPRDFKPYERPKPPEFVQEQPAFVPEKSETPKESVYTGATIVNEPVVEKWLRDGIQPNTVTNLVIEFAPEKHVGVFASRVFNVLKPNGKVAVKTGLDILDRLSNSGLQKTSGSNKEGFVVFVKP